MMQSHQNLLNFPLALAFVTQSLGEHPQGSKVMESDWSDVSTCHANDFTIYPPRRGVEIPLNYWLCRHTNTHTKVQLRVCQPVQMKGGQVNSTEDCDENGTLKECFFLAWKTVSLY